MSRRAWSGGDEASIRPNLSDTNLASANETTPSGTDPKANLVIAMASSIKHPGLLALTALLAHLASTIPALSQDAAARSPALLPAQNHSLPSGSRLTSDELGIEIANWIKKLGDPSYSVRLQAQSELERIGVRALDQLHQASFDPDPQISNQARFLVQSNQFNWAWETDPFPVRRTLSNYTTAPLYDKSVYIDQLNAMEGDEGLPALCRLIRYETQGCLAKRAALLVMRSKPPIGQSEIERKEWIASMVDGAMSTAGKWVIAYTSKEDPFSIEAWQQRIDRERELFDAKSPDTSIEIISDLRRWLVEHIADKPGLKKQSLDIARNVPEYFQTSGPGASASMIEFAQWALQFKLPELVQEQHGKLSSLMLQDPRFGYLLAESYEQQSEKEKAKKIADLTASRVPIDAQGEPKPFDPLANDDSPLNRRLEEMRLRNTSFVLQRASMGDFLIKRGMFDWAETELRYAIDGREAEPEFATTLNLSLLSQMLHELARNQEAADVLEKYKDRFEREPMFETQVTPNGGESLVSNYYLFRGDEAREKDNKPLAREMYVKAIELAEDNVDAIIGLYRLNDSSDEAIQERKRIHQRVASALRQEIDARERDLRRENPRFQATEQRSLANQMNTLAWLITNTEGNFEEALHLSRKACSLEPGRSAYLDTLAHCYATLERYREAVEQQRKAVALEPHQPSLVNALKEFEAKLQENPGS
jgi:tetratricopeptide (TPR) repeat protein